MKCNNCKNDAFYVYKITEDYKQLFCKRHLPRFLEPLRRAGNLETTEAFKKSAQKTLNALRAVPSEETVEPEVVVESEAVVDEAVVEEKPKPRKKSKPKSELAEDEVNS